LDFFDFLAMAREPTEAPAWLRPHADVAERALLPGDPGRALRLAQALTDAPKMLNHNRGLWGYSGIAADGRPLTIQSTGLGGPSAAAVVADLATLGVRRIVRVGTCVAVDESPLGTILEAGAVHALDGTSRALGASLPAAAIVASTDLPTEPVPAGARVRDLTSGAVVSAAARHGLEVAVVLVVVVDASGRRLGDEALHAAELELGRRALATLGAMPSASTWAWASAPASPRASGPRR
jgi:uridine phosphorylase